MYGHLDTPPECLQRVLPPRNGKSLTAFHEDIGSSLPSIEMVSAYAVAARRRGYCGLSAAYIQPVVLFRQYNSAKVAFDALHSQD